MKTKSLIFLLLSFFFFSSLHSQNSLRILNPNAGWMWQTGRIFKAMVSVQPKGLYMQYGLYLTLSVGEAGSWFEDSTRLEAVLDFTLPEGSIVYDSWLWVGNDIIQGRHIDRWSASNIYEGIVNRRRDPSLLVKQTATSYELRVYPMKKGETRKVKITYMVPADLVNGKIKAGLPADLLMASDTDPDLYVIAWENSDFTQPVINDPDILFESLYDTEFGSYKKAKVPAAKLPENPVFSMTSQALNNCFVGVYEGATDKYYQLSIVPGDYIELDEKSRIVVLIDHEPVNSTYSKAQILAELKEQMVNQFSANDEFNLIWSGLHTEKAFEEWTPITADNLDIAFEKVGASTLYSNLPGTLAEAMEFIKNNGDKGSIMLAATSDNFANYVEANNLIKDLKTIRDPLYPTHIADLQNKNVVYHYIGTKDYYGQEYLYINLSKISGGYYQTIRTQTYFSTLMNEVTGSLHGVITAFDLYSAPADGFCYGRFSDNTRQGFPVNQTVTQVGKYYGETPFLVYLTGIYRSQPFSKMITIGDEQIVTGDSLLAKMWNGRFIQELESGSQTTSITQQILFESLSNRVLSYYTAFLCLEPSDTTPVCTSCKDESRLTGIGDPIAMDSSGFLKLYPNPFTDRINMEIDLARLTGVDEVAVRIFNQTGQLVYEKNEPALAGQVMKLEWDGKSQQGKTVSAGHYIVLIKAGPVTWSRQVVKSE
ncbi:MAG: VIT domain-containing protein [Bacteroidota bacterium]